MKLRIGKELLEMMQWAAANTGYSMSKIATITLRGHAKQPLDIADVADPGGGIGGTVITVNAPEGMDQPTLRRLLWVRLSLERARDKKKPLPKSKAVENKDYVMVDDINNLNLSKQQIDDLLNNVFYPPKTSKKRH